MVQFSGDLLIGGAALRDIRGSLVAGTKPGEPHWMGRFTLEESPLLEIGRTYLLMLADGKARHVVVTECSNDDGTRVEVAFRSVD